MTYLVCFVCVCVCLFHSKWILQTATTNKGLATIGNNQILSVAASHRHRFLCYAATVSKPVTTRSQIESKFFFRSNFAR